MSMEDLLKNLNPAQRQAVVFEDGPLLILAGAGSGKTRVLTYRAAWLVISGRALPNQLLLLTFTNKAAEEMRKRLIGLLENYSDQSTRGIFAGTFHSFCAYVLRRDGEAIGINNRFIIYDEQDQANLLKKIVKKLDLLEKNFPLKTVGKIISSYKNKLLEPEDVLSSASNPYYQQIAQIYLHYQEEIEKMGGLDFDDLLFKTVILFHQEPKVLKKYKKQYKFLLVDEYQDTNQAQYYLTRLLVAEGKNLTVVGDASQAIYSWRGADYHNILSLKKDFPNLEVINLEQNYRSTQVILDAAFSVICKNNNHPILKLFTQKKGGEKIYVYRANSEVDEAEFVAEKIKELISFQKIDPTQIAILYRTNAQSRVFEEFFLEKGIPYILVGGVKFYDRAEIKNLLSMIRVAYNPLDNISWERIEKNLGIKRTLRIKEFLANHSLEGIATFDLIEELLQTSGYLEKFDKNSEEDRRRLENIEELKSVAQQFKDLGSFLENVALVQQEYSAQEKEKNNLSHQAVRLMTIHASKGLEFEAIFLVGLEEGLLPHSQSLDDSEKLEEERRLCYVAITRAKQHLYLTFTSRRLYFGRTNYNLPSRFLLDIPEDLLETDSGYLTDSLGEMSDEFDDDWDNKW